jgi:hypothetical protein
MKWGGITWVFLHTLSYKVHPEHYTLIKIDLWGHVKQLCSNLPCPDCASHASQYLKKMPVPDTKEKFIQVLVEFHNAVNRRLGKPLFSIKDVTKYGTVDLTRSFYACRHVITSQPYNPRMIMHKVTTWDMLTKFQKWLQQQRMIA